MNEAELRTIRMRNLDEALRQGLTTPRRLASELNCDTNYVAQLRIGFRPISFELARVIERAIEWTSLSLDAPPDPQTEPSTNRSIDWRTHRTRGQVRDAGRKSPPPRRVPNKAVRSREYLTPEEVEAIIKAAKVIGRHSHRDAALILISYRHGLRVSELVSLRWDQVDLKQGLLHVTRSKNGTPSNHPLGVPELRGLRRLRQRYASSPYVFVTERKGPMTESNVRKLVARAGRNARLPFPVHPHMLRHACGYKLANDGHDTRAIQHYLGHKNIVHTVRYTELASDRFKGFWSD